MGWAVIDQTVERLRAEGFKTQRAYPGMPMAAITQVVAAVQLVKLDYDARETVLEVKLLSPQNLGAEACEEAAVVVAEALKDIDLSTVVGMAAYDGKTGLFYIDCIATRPQKQRMYLDLPFKIGAVEQSRVVSFTAQQVAEPGPVTSETPWTVRLEQYFRNGYGEDKNPSGDEFTITNGEEIYHGCKWTSCKRITELEGTRQIREGTAMYRTIQ